MTNIEAREMLARKLDIDYANIANNGLFNDADLQDYIQGAAEKAWDFHPWDFTEGAKSGTLLSQNIISGYVDYPQDMVTGGANNLVVNGQEFALKDKLIYRNYRKFLEDNPNSKDKVWSEYKRFIFINMNACAAGQSFDVYGKLRCITFTQDADLLPFSPDSDNQEDSGNDAIVDLAYAEAMGSEKKKQYDVAAGIMKAAYASLNILWKPMADYHANQQARNNPMFSVPNYFDRGRTARNSPIGNFNVQ
jgi:hypothetical protein